MQIPTLVRRFTLIFLRYLIYLHVIHLSHSVTFATVAFLIISTVVTHRRLMVISSNNSQWCMVTWSCNICMWYLQYRTVNCRHVQHSIMTNVTLQQPGLRCSGACVARNMTGGRDRRPDAGYGKPTGPPSDAARRSVKILVLFLVSYWSRLKRPHSGSVGARWSETWARCDKESCSSHGGSCFGVEVWKDAAKLKNMVIAIFGDRWDLVRKSDVFIEYEADISSWVSGVKWGVVDFGKLLPMIVSRHSCIWYAVKQTSNPLIASAERQMTIIPLAI